MSENTFDITESNEILPPAYHSLNFSIESETLEVRTETPPPPPFDECIQVVNNENSHPNLETMQATHTL